MHIDRLEGLFLWLAAGMLLLFAGAVVISVFGMGIQLPSIVDTVNPTTLRQEAGFDRPGIREIYEGRYEVYMVVSQFSFDPKSIEVPVGSRVTFYLSSTDVIHGFKVFDTNVNIMVIPGQISEVTHTFDEPGDYQFYCHEYCGSGHHNMQGVVHVVEASDE